MSGSTETAGNLTLSGFDSSFLQTGGYSSSVTTGLYAKISGASAIFDQSGSPTQVVDSSGSSDAWTLTVTFNASNTTQYLQYRTSFSSAPYIEGGSGPTSFTFSGTGSTALQTFVQSFAYYADSATTVAGITFDLVDETTAGGGVAPSGQNNANETTFTAYVLACYAAGTRIATPAGERAIETLAIGDLVVTASGAAVPVKWIGRRAYGAAELAAHQQLRPVLIRAGALADNVPHRDLLVSPMHAMYVDDVLIPAVALVNGVSILRHDALEPVAYLHIELAGHDIVLAEGAPAETFVDDASRLMFDNADSYHDMYGADSVPAGFSTSRLEEGYQIAAIHRRLALRGGAALAPSGVGALIGHVERLAEGVLEGWVADGAQGAGPVELAVSVDGEPVARLLANRYRADLDAAGIAGGRCAFSLTLPASVTSLAQVSVWRTRDGAMVAMPAQALATV